MKTPHAPIYLGAELSDATKRERLFHATSRAQNLIVQAEHLVKELSAADLEHDLRLGRAYIEGVHRAARMRFAHIRQQQNGVKHNDNLCQSRTDRHDGQDCRCRCHLE
jgi:hypothetical protein